MAAEFEKLQALAREIEERVGQGGYPAWAAQAGDITRKAGQLAQKIRELHGPEYFIEPETSQSDQRSGDLSAEALAEFRAERGRLNTPEGVTKTYQAIWRERAERIGMAITVPEFPGSGEDLQEHLAKGDKPFFVPEELSTQQTRYLLGRMFPKMQSYAVQEYPVTNEVDHSGWRYTEASTDAPYLNTTEETLRKKIERKGKERATLREGLTLSEYIIASQDHQLLTGEYFDQGSTWVRLLGSRVDGCVVLAHFHSGGSLDVHWRLYPASQYFYFGGRSSEGVKKA